MGVIGIVEKRRSEKYIGENVKFKDVQPYQISRAMLTMKESCIIQSAAPGDQERI